MESITSTTSTQEQAYVAIPSEVGIGGILRITGDPGVLQDMYQQARAEQRQAFLEAPVRALGAVAGYIGNVASNIVNEVKLGARIRVFDALHATDYRQARAEMIERQRREQFLASIGLVAVRK